MVPARFHLPQTYVHDVSQRMRPDPKEIATGLENGKCAVVLCERTKIVWLSVVKGSGSTVGSGGGGTTGEGRQERCYAGRNTNSMPVSTCLVFQDDNTECYAGRNTNSMPVSTPVRDARCYAGRNTNSMPVSTSMNPYGGKPVAGGTPASLTSRPSRVAV